MDLRVSHENICIDEVVFKGVLEQGVAFDYTLPDYYPNIFKILSTKVDTNILSKRVMGNKIIIDGIFNIKVIYISEESGKIKQLEQKQAFSKNIDLKEVCDTLSVSVKSKCDYVNTRAQNQRKLDIRGSVSLYVEAYKPSTKNLICGCDELQVRKKEIEICEQKIYASKDFSVKESLEIGNGKPPILDVINYESTAHITEYKIIANKIILKGEVMLHTLYVCSDKSQKPQIIEHQIPISQIIDVEGVNEDYICSCAISSINYDIDLQVDDDGECRRFIAELTFCVDCMAIKNKNIQLIEDCYSTAYETKYQSNRINTCRCIKNVNEIKMVKHIFELEENNFECIFDIMPQIGAVMIEKNDTILNMNVDIIASLLAIDNEGNAMSEKIAFATQIPIDCPQSEFDIEFNPNLTIISVGYTMLSQTEVEIRLEIKVCGAMFASETVTGISEIVLDEQMNRKPKDDSAIRMYLGDMGENVWDIAKKYNTSVMAILEHNAIDDEKLTKRGMIFIPIVD